jgi:hypothetical protein
LGIAKSFNGCGTANLRGVRANPAIALTHSLGPDNPRTVEAAT